MLFVRMSWKISVIGRLVSMFNDIVCSCGKHRGKGDGTPYELAMIYNWFRQRKRSEWYRNENGMQKYLESYEKAHGKLASDEFIFKRGGFAKTY